MKAMMSEDKDAWAIRWLTPEIMGAMAAAVRAREPLLKHVFGFVDGLNLRIYQPGYVEEQNAYYNGWLGDTYCSQVIIFLTNGEIAWASFNNAGSWHEAKIANGLYDILSNPERTPAPFALLADSAFPNNQEVSGKILSKPKENVAAKEQDGNTHRLWEAIIPHPPAPSCGMGNGTLQG
ncbi:unnamed protein product [Tilletia caries]|nr:unnamed protein product [Tilletia caries]